MTDNKPQTINIDNVEYVRKDSIATPATNTDGLPYAVIRTYSAGVFAGYIKRRDGKEVELVSARRLWRWAGANTLSDIAANGVNKPDQCKFPLAVDVTVTEAIEILPATEAARSSIEGVPTWKS